MAERTRTLGHGELVVAVVRAEALSRELRAAIMRAKSAGGTNRGVWFFNTSHVYWEANRLRSACERALGRRNRHYDTRGGA